MQLVLLIKTLKKSPIQKLKVFLSYKKAIGIFEANGDCTKFFSLLLHYIWFYYYEAIHDNSNIIETSAAAHIVPTTKKYSLTINKKFTVWLERSYYYCY